MFLFSNEKKFHIFKIVLSYSVKYSPFILPFVSYYYKPDAVKHFVIIISSNMAADILRQHPIYERTVDKYFVYHLLKYKLPVSSNYQRYNETKTYFMNPLCDFQFKESVLRLFFMQSKFYGMS